MADNCHNDLAVLCIIIVYMLRPICFIDGNYLPLVCGLHY